MHLLRHGITEIEVPSIGYAVGIDGIILLPSSLA
jgi:hypothetical protein